MKTGHERNQKSLNRLFNSKTDHQDYIMKQLNDAEKHLDKLEDLYDTAEYFAKEDDLIGVNHASRDMKEDTYALRRKTLQTKSMMNSRRAIKSEYEDEDDSEVTEFYVSLGECGYDGTITVTKEEDGKWHGEDGAVFMGYLTPEEVVEWYDKDYGCAWLCNSRRPIKSEYHEKDRIADIYTTLTGYNVEKVDIGWWIPELDKHFYSIADMRKWMKENKKSVQSSCRLIKSESNMIDVILDEMNKIIREECKGMEITDRTELFTGELYNVAKKRLTDRLIPFMV